MMEDHVFIRCITNTKLLPTQSSSSVVAVVVVSCRTVKKSQEVRGSYTILQSSTPTVLQ